MYTSPATPLCAIVYYASYGDVMLTNTSLVLICINSQWGTLNGTVGSTVASTLCRQLGYEEGCPFFEESPTYDE